jgi:predicted nucleotidyltransferase
MLAMDRDVIIEQLRARRSEFTELGVRRLVLFGPAARNEGGPAGEVDFLVELAPPLTFDHYLAVRDYLARLLGRTVELVMEDLHHPNIWPYIQDDAIEI